MPLNNKLRFKIDIRRLRIAQKNMRNKRTSRKQFDLEI